MLNPTLDAHNVSNSRGRALIENGRIVVNLNVPTADIVHLYALAPEEDGLLSPSITRKSAQRHASDLSASFRIWDDAGEELAAGPFQLNELSSTQVQYTAVYSFLNQPRILSFRFLPVDERFALVRQFTIAVHGSQDPASRTIHLTSRGNVETVEVKWQDSSPRMRADDLSRPDEATACRVFGDRSDDRFRQVFVEAKVQADSVEASISVPLPLLETWLPVPRRAEGALDLQEMQAVIRMTRSLMESALEAESGGRQLPCELVELNVMSAAEPVPPAAAAKSTIGFFSSRLQAELRCSVSAQVDSLNLQWMLVNSLVLSVPAAVHADGRCQAGEFSTYQPSIQWQRHRDNSSLGR